MPEHQPGEPASATGLYHEVNVFGLAWRDIGLAVR